MQGVHITQKQAEVTLVSKYLLFNEGTPLHIYKAIFPLFGWTFSKKILYLFSWNSTSLTRF